MSRFLLVLCLMGVSLGLRAQEPEIVDDSHTVYQVYLTTVAPGSSLAEFADLEDLGFVQIFSMVNPPTTPGPSRALEPQAVYLGSYLGLETAEHVLQKVRTRGYIDARIEADTRSLTEGSNRNLTYTLQVGAFNELDMDRFTKVANIPAYGMFVKWEKGYFKVFAGMYSEAELDYLKGTVQPYFKSQWGIDGFPKSFRSAYVAD
ncbi:MAG: hypothetical protein AAFV07_04000 [Bacteroidota bacterium]